MKGLWCIHGGFSVSGSMKLSQLSFPRPSWEDTQFPIPCLLSALQWSHSCSPFSCITHNQKGSTAVPRSPLQWQLSMLGVFLPCLHSISIRFPDKPEMAVMGQKRNSCAHEYSVWAKPQMLHSPSTWLWHQKEESSESPFRQSAEKFCMV